MSLENCLASSWHAANECTDGTNRNSAPFFLESHGKSIQIVGLKRSVPNIAAKNIPKYVTEMSDQHKRGMKFAIVLVCLLQGVRSLQSHCPYIVELGSSTRLLCYKTQANISSVSWTRPDGVLASNCISLGCDNQDGYAIGRNSSHSEIKILRMDVEDIGSWTCSTSSGTSGCSVEAYKSPSCNITKDNDCSMVTLTDQLVLWVDIADGYCSGTSTFTLQVGDVTEKVFTTEGNISSKRVPVTLNVTERHYGPLEVTFLCLKKRNNLRCIGLKEIDKKTPNNDQPITTERERANSSAIVLTPVNITAAAAGVILLTIIVSIPASRCCTKVDKQTIKYLDPPSVTMDCPTGCEYASVVDLGVPSRTASLKNGPAGANKLVISWVTILAAVVALIVIVIPVIVTVCVCKARKKQRNEAVAGFNGSILNSTHINLKILKVESTHAGLWTCEDASGGGSASCELRVKKTGPAGAHKPGISWVTILAAVVALIVIVIPVFVTVCVWKTRKKQSNKEGRSDQTSRENYEPTYDTIADPDNDPNEATLSNPPHVTEAVGAYASVDIVPEAINTVQNYVSVSNRVKASGIEHVMKRSESLKNDESEKKAVEMYATVNKKKDRDKKESG
ncbi:uncharacterized protein [Haliotis asinina]|uniref:uncharacterized protein n=1 Tax=Haliotis asinina TaxID=109174 RepID=UPI003531F995